jgi:hypothetical protein
MVRLHRQYDVVLSALAIGLVSESLVGFDRDVLIAGHNLLDDTDQLFEYLTVFHGHDPPLPNHIGGDPYRAEPSLQFIDS